MRAILIDPNTQKVERITLEGETLEALRGAIGCQVLTVEALGTEVDLWLDDEGLLVEAPLFFEIDGGHQPFAGRGVILGHSREGKTTPCPDYVTADRIRDFVSFPETESVIMPELVSVIPMH